MDGVSGRAAAAAAVFTVEVMPERDGVRVIPAGELDLATSGRLGTEVRALFDRGFADVVVDLRELTFMDSSGVHELMACDRHAATRGGRLSVIAGSGGVARILDLCGVRELLDVVPGR